MHRFSEQVRIFFVIALSKNLTLRRRFIPLSNTAPPYLREQRRSRVDINITLLQFFAHHVFSVESSQPTRR